MTKTRKSFKKASDRVEVVLDPTESYQSTAIKACHSLDMKVSRNSKLTLLRMSGSIIPDKDIGGQLWTIGRYVKQAFSSRSCNNIGVAIVDTVHVHVVSWHGTHVHTSQVSQCVYFI